MLRQTHVMRHHTDNDVLNDNSICKDSSESEIDDLFLVCEIRKNRRKNLMPQKAIQSVEVYDVPCSKDHESLPAIETLQNHTFKRKYLKSSNDSDSISSGNKILPKSSNNEDVFQELNASTGVDKKPGSSVLKDGCQTYRAVKCNMCEQVFHFRTDFDKHYMQNYGLPPVYTCTFCNKTTEKFSAFRSHCYRHITEGRFKCNDCPKGFSLKSLLHVHVLAKHSNAKPFSCTQCGKCFCTKPGLLLHMKKHKNEMKEDYPCVICGKILHTRGGLTSHMNVHRLGRRFMCDLCGRTFTQKVNMEQHLKHHTGDKPFVCDKCGKKFSEKSHLVRHYSFHSEQRPFKCDICQKLYKTERCLKVHHLVHASKRPYVCDYCNKGFLSSTKLKQHSNIHTGERPYKCKYCDRTFTNCPNLLKHTRRKHKTHGVLDKNDEIIQLTDRSDSNSLCTSNSSLNQIVSNGEVSLVKNNGTALKQTSSSILLIDEKCQLPQSFDLVTCSNNGLDLMVPYLSTSLPCHQSLIQHFSQCTLSHQITELLHNQCNQPISYE